MKSRLYEYLTILGAFALTISVTTKAIATTDNSATVKRDRHFPQLIERAKQLYQEEQYTEANRIWQQAVSFYQQQQDVLNQAMALSNLALTQQQLRELTTAQKSIASSIKLLQTQPQTETQQRILANSLDIQGSIARSQVKPKIAWEIWQQAAKIYQELNNNRALKLNKQKSLP